MEYNKKNINQYKKLYSLFSRSDKLKIILLFLMMMIAALLEVAGLGMIPVFVSIVANPQRVLENEYLGPWLNSLNITESRDLLIYGSIALVAIFIVKNSYILIYRYTEARFIYKSYYMFSYKMMKAYMQAPYILFLQRNTSELIRNTKSEVHSMIYGVLLPILQIAKESIMGLSILILLLYVEPLITITTLLIVGFISAKFIQTTKNRIAFYGRKSQQYRKESLQYATQAFSGIKEARVLNLESYFIHKFRKTMFEMTRLSMLKTVISNIPKPLLETIAVMGVMVMALIMHAQGRPTVEVLPVIALFGVAIVRLMPSVQHMTKMITDLRYNIVSVNPIYDDLSLLKPFENNIDLKNKIDKKINLKKHIQVFDIYYQYPDSEEQVLKGINMMIHKGQAVGFVGPSGAGKTTMVDVLLGLLEPTRGELLVDGVSIRDNISAWQRNIGYIPQFIYLTDDTIKRNIAFGISDEEIDEARINHVLELAQLSDLVSRLPEELDTLIGERGTRLSGGQRQRIGIARALYHDPQVLVMDEATSSLDNATEKHIVRAIEYLKVDRTIIMIAHRLTTVMNCDKLYVFENGEIIDEGTYTELLVKKHSFINIANK